MKIEYLVMLGCGAVAQTLLELFALERAEVNKLVIVEPLDIPHWIIGAEHIKVALTSENMKEILNPVIKKNCLVIDLTVNVDAIPVMEICKAKRANYINTSLESWEDKEDDGKLKITEENVLFYRLNKARKAMQNAKSTILIDSGANPGLIQSFVKMGLKKVAEKYKDDESLKNIANEEFNKAAERMGLEVIHVSELDTQESKIPLRPDTFYNTWSSKGFEEEALDLVSIGYGSCENNKNRQWIKPTDSKNPTVRILKKRGCDVVKNSFCVDHNEKVHKIQGWCIPHAENNTICKYLQHKNYRPSVYYVYHPSRPAIESINRMKENNYEPLPKSEVLQLKNIMPDSSFDSVGALLFFSGNGSIKKLAHWYGSSLSTKEVKDLGFKVGTATTVQVAISVFNSIKLIQSKQTLKKLITPEDLNYKYMIEKSRKYLGKIISKSFSYCESPPLSFDKF